MGRGAGSTNPNVPCSSYRRWVGIKQDVPCPHTFYPLSRATRGMAEAEQPGATGSGREQSEDCEHRTFPRVSTMALLLLSGRESTALRHGRQQHSELSRGTTARGLICPKSDADLSRLLLAGPVATPGPRRADTCLQVVVGHYGFVVADFLTLSCLILPEHFVLWADINFFTSQVLVENQTLKGER